MDLTQWRRDAAVWDARRGLPTTQALHGPLLLVNAVLSFRLMYQAVKSLARSCAPSGQAEFVRRELRYYVALCALPGGIAVGGVNGKRVLYCELVEAWETSEDAAQYAVCGKCGDRMAPYLPAAKVEHSEHARCADVKAWRKKTLALAGWQLPEWHLCDYHHSGEPRRRLSVNARVAEDARRNARGGGKSGTP